MRKVYRGVPVYKKLYLGMMNFRTLLENLCGSLLVLR